MNQKLMDLPIEVLAKLKRDVDEAMTARRYELFKIGKRATFYSEKKGRQVIIRITKINSKTIMGDEVNERGLPTGGKWKCSPGCLTVLPDQVKPVAAPIGTGADEPQSEEAGSF